MKILVTGAAGFIGFHVCQRLLQRGDQVVAIDNLSSYYDPQLKQDRLNRLLPESNFTFHKLDVADNARLAAVFETHNVEYVIHLAAQAGVRYSIENPRSYIDANIVGFLNILECCRHNGIVHLSYASSSSVYGANTRQPFAESDNVDHPLSLYAASKKSNELMAHTYSNLFQIPTTGLRFFTVYGPWGRPDMALYRFTKGIAEEEEIEIYNQGNMLRDFTYIDDIVEGIVRINDTPAQADKNWQSETPNPASSFAPYRVYNIGNNSPVKLLDLIHAIEKSVGKKAKKKMMPIQLGDMLATCADTSALTREHHFHPTTDFQQGVEAFVRWYMDYYSIQK